MFLKPLVVLHQPNLTPPHEPNLVNLKFDEHGKEVLHKRIANITFSTFYALHAEH